jgi:hypothetical protein
VASGYSSSLASGWSPAQVKQRNLLADAFLQVLVGKSENRTMSDQIPAPVQNFVDAINNADTDAFVALFTADGFIDDWGRKLPGHGGARSWANSDAIGAGAKMTLLTAETNDAVARVRFNWSSSVFNGQSDGVFVLEGDKIASFSIPHQ